MIVANLLPTPYSHSLPELSTCAAFLYSTLNQIKITRT